MRVLIAESVPAAAVLLRLALQPLNWDVSTVTSGKQVLELISTQSYDIAIIELNLSEVDGLEILRQARHLAPTMKCILASASLGIDETVRAMKLGAYHCCAKPYRLAEILDLLQNITPVAPPEDGQPGGDIVAVSKTMRELLRTLRVVGRSRASTVLLTGETGSGKEVVARTLHQLSEQRGGPFVAVNCSAIPATLIESELFGHEKGAFTDARLTRKGYLEAAGEGTLFLDEIGDLPLELQSKLLRALQERTFRRVGTPQELPFRARVIAATNVDLAQAVAEKRFRADLYYRLAVIPIHVLPLRERQEDILPLAEVFIRQFGRELGGVAPELTAAHRQQLLAYPWPGNVRELRNVIERFVLIDGRLEFLRAGAPDAVTRHREVDVAEHRVLFKALRKLLSAESSETLKSLVNA